MASPEICRWTLAEVVDALRSRAVSTEELIDATLTQIARVDGDVQAFVSVTEELAREHARYAQKQLDTDGDAAPVLTGVPLAVKDLFHVAGVRTTAGSRVYEEYVADTDSQAWVQLRRYGAALIGKANTHEFAYGGATEPTRNPWDTSKITGGSSGGSAAALAASMCFGAVGTDTAGSVRIPAALCGVVGLKPTNHALSTDGVIPLSPSLDVVGPMARTPEDTRILFAALRGDQEVAPRPAGSIAGTRIGVIAPQGAVAAEVVTGLDRAADALRDAGADVERVGFEVDLAQAASVNFTIMGAEGAAFHRPLLAAHEDKYSDAVRARLHDAAHTSAVDYIDALDARAKLRAQVDDALDGFDALLLNGVPCMASPAYDTRVHIQGQLEDRDWVLCRDMAFANVTGHPVLQVPAGCGDGIPVGVQLLSRRNSEDALFGPGQAIFDRLAWPMPNI